MLGRFVPTHDDLFFPFPYMPPLPLCIYKLFSEYFLEHAAIIFLNKNIKNKKFFYTCLHLTEARSFNMMK